MGDGTVGNKNGGVSERVLILGIRDGIDFGIISDDEKSN